MSRINTHMLSVGDWLKKKKNPLTRIKINSIDRITDYAKVDVWSGTEHIIVDLAMTLNEIADEYEWANPYNNYSLGQPKCICGLKFTREGGKHSDWCEIKNDGESDGSKA